MPIHHQSSALLPLCGLTLFCLSLVACPDPEGEYEAFNARRDEALANMAGEAAGEMAGEMAGDMAGEMAGDVAGEMPEPTSIPPITSGTYLFGLAPTLNLERPMVFVADVELEVNEDGSAGRIISMVLDPRTCDDLNVSAGEAVTFRPDMPSEISSNTTYSADFGTQVVAGSANCISGSRIEAQIKLDGRVTSEDTLCGELNGALILPYEADLAGSTFAARRLNEIEEADLSMTEVPKNCGDIEAYLGSE